MFLRLATISYPRTNSSPTPHRTTPYHDTYITPYTTVPHYTVPHRTRRVITPHTTPPHPHPHSQPPRSLIPLALHLRYVWKSCRTSSVGYFSQYLKIISLQTPLSRSPSTKNYLRDVARQEQVDCVHVLRESVQHPSDGSRVEERHRCPHHPSAQHGVEVLGRLHRLPSEQQCSRQVERHKHNAQRRIHVLVPRLVLECGVDGWVGVVRGGVGILMEGVGGEGRI